MESTIKYKVPKVIIDAVEKYLETHNIANRGEFDGDYEKQRIGKIGECVVYSRLYKKMLPFNEGGFDGGVDIRYKGFSIDVKTMGRKGEVKKGYTNNFIDKQLKYNTDILVFCSYNKGKNVLEICGWIFKCELEGKGVKRKKGDTMPSGSQTFEAKGDMWNIDNKDLYPFEYLEDYSESDLKSVQLDREKKNDCKHLSEKRNLETR